VSRRISKYFTREEMRCKCNQCSCDSMDAETLRIADAIREHVGHPIRPNSAHRCPAHNKAVGGAKASQHLYARALDLHVENPAAVALWVRNKFPHVSTGTYPFFIHIDTRSGPARHW